MKKLLLLLLLAPLVSCSVGDDEINDCTDSELGVNCQGADYIQNSDSHTYFLGKLEKRLL